jgi:hypothetical protein
MSRQYVMMYAVYDPNNYRGHRIKHLEGDTFEEVEKAGHAWLEGMAGKGNWEYVIAEAPSSYRIYNNKTHKRG